MRGPKYLDNARPHSEQLFRLPGTIGILFVSPIRSLCLSSCSRLFGKDRAVADCYQINGIKPKIVENPPTQQTTASEIARKHNGV
jgi:hypothetical protein